MVEKYNIPSAGKPIEAPEAGLAKQAQELARALIWDRALRHKLERDPEAREGLEALKRSSKNAFIIMADVLPAVGSVVHWSADILKLSRRRDMTPDVSKLTAWGTNIIDVLTLDTIPSYWIQAVLQFRKDLPRLKKLLGLIREIRRQEMEDYKRSKSEIDSALDQFPEDKK